MAMSTFLNVKTPAHERSLKPILKPTSIYTVRSISCFAYKYDELHKMSTVLTSMYESQGEQERCEN